MKVISLVCLVMLSTCTCVLKRDIVNQALVLLEYSMLYPDEALERGLEGKVLMRVMVSERGRVTEAYVQESSGYSLLDSAAVKSAYSFVFSIPYVDGNPVRSTVLVPIEYSLRTMDLDNWITQVKVLQERLKREHDDKLVEELYNLYKQLIYSTRFRYTLEINDYIQEAVLDPVRILWDDTWHMYPASILLFLDIITRYPDLFISVRATADFNMYLRDEMTRMRHMLPEGKAESLIADLKNFVE
jgi:TonB family protein